MIDEEEKSYFIQTMMISQAHARIYELQNERERYNYEGIIEASNFTNPWGFKSYRLVSEPKQETLI